MQAYLSSGQTITTGTWTDVTLNAEEYDIGSNFNTTTHLFTAPVPGKYQILGLIVLDTMAAADKIAYIRIDKNSGTSIAANLFHNASLDALYCGCDFYAVLVKDDTIGLQCYHNSGSNQILASGVVMNTNMAIKLISKD